MRSDGVTPAVHSRLISYAVTESNQVMADDLEDEFALECDEQEPLCSVCGDHGGAQAFVQCENVDHGWASDCHALAKSSDFQQQLSRTGYIILDLNLSPSPARSLRLLTQLMPHISALRQ